MKVEIFRRTVKDRRRGASWDLLQHMATGIKACGDEPVIVNEGKVGPWDKNEMEPTAPDTVEQNKCTIPRDVGEI